jgi:hypothetical protein
MQASAAQDCLEFLTRILWLEHRSTPNVYSVCEIVNRKRGIPQVGGTAESRFRRRDRLLASDCNLGFGPRQNSPNVRRAAALRYMRLGSK